MEKQANINPRLPVTTTLDYRLWRTAKENNIKFNDALALGIYSKMIDLKIMDISELPANYCYFTKEIARLKKEKAEILIKLNQIEGQNGETD